VARPTQEALYAEIDLELSWSERELPQVERTKHVHSLHPYLGKFIPQLVEVFLRRYFSPGARIFDPFVGSGTTLVEANVFGAHAVGSDISAFNCLLSEVKTTKHPLGRLDLALRGALEELRRREGEPAVTESEWLHDWYAPRSLAELLRYRAIAEEAEGAVSSVAQVILSRAARSARLTTHFDLDFPREPMRGPYFCFKHKRTCRPVQEAGKFLKRYTEDTVRRLREFASLSSDAEVQVIHGDARAIELPSAIDGIITSPPYPGLIDYHEQHRYAYELLGLEDKRAFEIGPAVRGSGRTARSQYVEAIAASFRNARRFLAKGAPVIIVVNDSRSLYPEILDIAGLRLEQRLTRHVNRRTGRRAGEFFEDVLVCFTR
jgi:hypothetical protein